MVMLAHDTAWVTSEDIGILRGVRIEKKKIYKKFMSNCS